MKQQCACPSVPMPSKFILQGENASQRHPPLSQHHPVFSPPSFSSPCGLFPRVLFSWVCFLLCYSVKHLLVTPMPGCVPLGDSGVLEGWCVLGEGKVRDARQGSRRSGAWEGKSWAEQPLALAWVKAVLDQPWWSVCQLTLPDSVHPSVHQSVYLFTPLTLFFSLPVSISFSVFLSDSLCLTFISVCLSHQFPLFTISSFLMVKWFCMWRSLLKQGQDLLLSSIRSFISDICVQTRSKKCFGTFKGRQSVAVKNNVGNNE